VRKKIPTITRPDPAYAASLRPEVEEDPGREEVQRAEAMPEPANVRSLSSVDDHATAAKHAACARASTQTGDGRTCCACALASPTRPRRSPATRKIDIRVNALERQEEALIDCGVDPAHVIRAALRRAVKNWELGSRLYRPLRRAAHADHRMARTHLAGR
jgi:hypothetical protein